MNAPAFQLLLRSAALALAALSLSLAPRAAAQAIEKELPPQARGLEVAEKLGKFLPLELQFTNAEGQKVTLGDYFPAATGKLKPGQRPKPAIVAMVYYRCPVVCSAVMNKLAQSVEQIRNQTVGRDFNLIFVSFDPTETADAARQRRDAFVMSYGRSDVPEVPSGWNFHVATENASQQLANALGFGYRKLANGEYSHPVALFVITPEGKIARYIYGFDYPPDMVTLALIDAADGKISASVKERFVSFCYMYDPRTGQYTLAAWRVMQIAGVSTVLLLASGIAIMHLGEAVRKRAARDAAQGAALGAALRPTPTPPVPPAPSR